MKRQLDWCSPARAAYLKWQAVWMLGVALVLAPPFLVTSVAVAP